MNLKIAAAMVPDIKGDKERNFAASEDLIRRLAGLGADMVVLPESCLQGYPVSEEAATRESITAGAEASDGPYPKRYRSLAHELGIYLVACYDESRGDKIYNTAELIGRDGNTIGFYSKTHTLSGNEPKAYSPGDDLPVYQTEYGSVGILICNDRTFFESWRVMMLKGAQIILILSNGSHGEFNTCRLRAYAHDNGLAVLFAHPRQALVIDSSGEVIAKNSGGEEYAMAALDLDEGDEMRESFRRRRRPDLYVRLI